MADKEFVKSIKEQEAPVAVVKEPEVKTDAQTVDAKTTLFNIYLLYRMNVISRQGVREALDVIKGNVPTDILQYLLDEVKKS